MSISQWSPAPQIRTGSPEDTEWSAWMPQPEFQKPNYELFIFAKSKHC